MLEALGRHERDLIRYATRLTGDVERARDCVQETFLRLCGRGGDVPAEHRTEWLYTVCRNLALDVRRKERPMQTGADATTETTFERAADDAPPGARLEHEEEVAGVLGVLGTLPANQQEVIRLKFQHGLSYREIAGVTKHSVSHVGVLIHAGMKTLRQKLAGDGLAEAAR